MIKPRTHTLQTQNEMKEMGRRILLCSLDHSLFCFVLFDGKIQKIIAPSKNYEIGDVFVGKVINILKNGSGAFVQFMENEIGFLPAERMKNVSPLNRESESVKNEDSILVQIRKMPFGEKKPMLSTNIKIDSKDKLAELKEAAKHVYDYTKLYEAPSALELYLKKYPLSKDEKIITDHEEGKLLASSLVQKGLLSEEQFYYYQDENLSMYSLYGLKAKLSNLLSRKVLLASGGSLIFDETEAFVIVDVNTGKNVSGKNKDDAILALNLEAVKEIVYQINARNLSGMILVDFINMESEEYNNILLNEYMELGQECSPIIHVLDLTKLGIIEASRKKEEESIGKYRDLFYRTILI